MTVTKEVLINKLQYGRIDMDVLNKFLESTREKDQEWKSVVAEVKGMLERGEIKVGCCYVCGLTGPGSDLMAGSLGLLCQWCYDNTESNL